jgi:hypothetical protein
MAVKEVAVDYLKALSQHSSLRSKASRDKLQPDTSRMQWDGYRWANLFGVGSGESR